MKLLVSKYKTHDIVGHIPDFLTEEECDSLYKINEDMPWKLAGTRYSGYNTKIRKCKKRSNITFPYYDRLIRAVNLYNDRSYKFHLHQDRSLLFLKESCQGEVFGKNNYLHQSVDNNKSLK